MHIWFEAVFVALCAVVVATASPARSITDVSECSCGYYDQNTRDFYTDSAIVYFNETTSLPVDIFATESYENKYEKGWNTRYVQGASPSNVDVRRDSSTASSNTSLQLYVEPSNADHLVVGGSVQSVRRDIFYGSFRALMRSPRSWSSGSALSMTLHYNESQTINLDLMNPDDPSKAWVGLFMRDEFPDRDLGVNYSTLANNSNGVLPWDYTEYRVDWSEKKVDYYIGGKLFRSVHKDGKLNYPQTPASLRFKHWSVGNWFTMQGPPKNRSVANVGWVRSFFNSSLTTEHDREKHLSRCNLSQACSTENLALRGSSPLHRESTADWTQAKLPNPDRSIPKIILIICGCLSGFLLANALLRRLPRPQRKSKLLRELEKMKTQKFHPSTYGPSVGLTSERAVAFPSPPLSRPVSHFGDTNSPTPIGSSQFSLGDYLYSQKSAGTSIKTFNASPTPNRLRISWREFSDKMQVPQQNVGTAPPRTGVRHDSEIAEFGVKDPTVRFADSWSEDGGIGGIAASTGHKGCLTYDLVTVLPADSPQKPAAVYPTVRVGDHPPLAEMLCLCSDDSSDESETSAPPSQLRRRPRIDYLAGLLAFSCLLVTAIQFSLTFSPASVDPGADRHYATETWVRKTVGPYLLNLVWVGPFLLTSTRFLVWEYLESNGDLQAIAEITVRRPFRLLVPILAIAMLEYFFMDSGAVNWLEYMASVTWSTWPFVNTPNNFGYFLSEIMELAYLIPNAAPQITFNYCTGILWSIPVQLQGSWITLLGVIVIREIRTPYKRFCYYAFCIFVHWYALSWGTYFYFGIMLADLEINFQYRKWLYARPRFYYPMILVCATAALGGLAVDMATQWTGVNYAAYEYGIHPDIPTGRPIMFTGAVGYPQYYVPKLNGIVFAFGLQTLIEVSPLVQKFFSLKILTFAFKHIYTVYLIHGFVFWSLGSLIFIYLSKHDFAYWQIVTVVAVSCYAALFLGVPVITPVVTALGKSVPRNIWQYANETPSPRKPTLHPFPNNFLFVRQAFVQDEGPKAAAQKDENVVSTKPRGLFKKFVASVVAALNPRFSNQPCQPEVSLARSASVKVGWRTGGLSKNVVMLKRNNSNASRADARE